MVLIPESEVKTAIFSNGGKMEWVEKPLDSARRSLCCTALAMLLLMALSSAFAQGKSAKSTKDDLFQDSLLGGKGFGGDIYIYHDRHIFTNGPMMPLKRFLVSYRSEETDERNAAFAFLLGITDATEGKIWCNRDNYTSNTVFEAVNEGLKRLKLSQHNERAAYVITDILEKKYPCKKKQSKYEYKCKDKVNISMFQEKHHHCSLYSYNG
jgi:hypothetical protein